jgi:hypothetical protein
MQPNASGVYAVRFYKQGLPQEVLVDDHFPCLASKVRHQINDIWPYEFVVSY